MLTAASLFQEKPPGSDLPPAPGVGASGWRAGGWLERKDGHLRSSLRFGFPFPCPSRREREGLTPGTLCVSGDLTAVPVLPVLHTRTQVLRDGITPRLSFVPRVGMWGQVPSARPGGEPAARTSWRPGPSLPPAFLRAPAPARSTAAGKTTPKGVGIGTAFCLLFPSLVPFNYKAIRARKRLSFLPAHEQHTPVCRCQHTQLLCETRPEWQT